eukprot:scaffold200990_cov27-Prasinocladus_malaysianus.AAC.2
MMMLVVSKAHDTMRLHRQHFASNTHVELTSFGAWRKFIVWTENTVRNFPVILLYKNGEGSAVTASAMAFSNNVPPPPPSA